MNAEYKERSLKLEEAVVKSDVELLDRLLEKKLEWKCLEGALVKASAATNVDAVQLLLDHVESRHVTDALRVMFRAAATAGRDDFMSLSAAIKLQPDNSVPSADLCWAAGRGYSAWLKPLLDNGVDVNSTGRGLGLTALHAAASNGHVDCLTTLIEHGADVNAGTGVGTLLHSTASWDYTEYVTVLLQHGADINSRDCGGSTPLHCAARCGRVDCFEIDASPIWRRHYD